MKTKRVIYKALGVVAGITFAVFGVQDRSHIAHLQKVGKSAIVDPIDGYTEHKSKGNKTYTAEFHFTTGAGVKIAKKQSFPKEALDDFQAQRPVKVLYDPANANDFIFEQEKATWWMVLGGVALAIVALIFA
ncbi:MAG TPA: hypothetical protein VGC21_15230 [Telluria sp.]|jgi:hypothetical protein